MKRFFLQTLFRACATAPRPTLAPRSQHPTTPPPRPFLLQTASIVKSAHSDPPPVAPTPPPPGQSPPERVRLPYLVRRTPSCQLPVYRRIQSGGTRRTTQIKKIDGDLQRLRDDVLQALKLKKEIASINSRTRHIVLKGDHLYTVKQWLLERGF